MLARCDRCHKIVKETVIAYTNDDQLCEKCSRAEAEKLFAAGLLQDPDAADYDPDYDIPDDMYDEPEDEWPALTTFDEYDRFHDEYY